MFFVKRDKNQIEKQIRFTGEIKRCDNMRQVKMISGFHYVEVSCLYCYKRKFWIDNNFSFRIGTYHEDFGLA